MLILAKYYNEGIMGDKDIIAGRYWYNQELSGGHAQQDATGIAANAQSFLDFMEVCRF